MIKYILGIMAALCGINAMAAQMVRVETQCAPLATTKLVTIIFEENPSKDALVKLLKGGANPNETDQYGVKWDPLSAAIFEGRFDLVEPLITAGANPRSEQCPPIPFMAALHYGYEGCCANAGSLDGHHPYCFPIRAQEKNGDGYTCDHRQEAFEAALETLIKAGAEVDAQINDLAQTAAIMAFERGDIKTGSKLIKHGANLKFVCTQEISAD